MLITFAQTLWTVCVVRQMQFEGGLKLIINFFINSIVQNSLTTPVQKLKSKGTLNSMYTVKKSQNLGAFYKVNFKCETKKLALDLVKKLETKFS